MRWIRKHPERGETRVKQWFAILPVEIDDDTRWLEWVIVKQTHGRYIWYNDAFIDPPLRDDNLV